MEKSGLGLVFACFLFCAEVFTEICLQLLCAWKMVLLWWQYEQNNSVTASKLLPLQRAAETSCSFMPRSAEIWWQGGFGFLLPLNVSSAISRTNEFCATVQELPVPWYQAAQWSTGCALSVLPKTISDFTYSINWIPYYHTFWALRVLCKALHSFCEKSRNIKPLFLQCDLTISFRGWLQTNLILSVKNRQLKWLQH